VRVRFRELSDAEIEAYLRPNSPTTAPAAPRARAWASRCSTIDSDDPTALVGLPLIRTCRMLRAAGLRVF
jgi:septum formation protein